MDTENSEDGSGRSTRRRLVHRLAYEADKLADRVRESVRGPIERMSVEPYLAHGSTDRVIARGRVFAGELVASASEAEPTTARIRRTVKRFATDELPGITIEARLGTAEGRGVTDAEGYYRIELSKPDLSDDRWLHDMTVEVIGKPDADVTVGPARAHIPTSGTRRLIVSDIDDTVLATGATRTAKMVLTTLTGSAFTRSGFPGTAELYTGLRLGAGDQDNGFAYVSSSPWNLYGFLETFLERTSLPVGPLFLRDLGIDEETFIHGSHDEHKRSAIEELLSLHDLSMVLVGDTGQRDPEIYRSIVDAHAGRIDAVLLRHVHDDQRRGHVEDLFAESGVPMAVQPDSPALCLAAERIGLVPPGWASRVEAAVQTDAPSSSSSLE